MEDLTMATQKEITEYIMNNLDELSSTDLMQLSRIAREIVDKRMEQCKEEGLFGDDCEADCKKENKIFRISYEKDAFGLWRRIYLFNKCINGKLIARWCYI
jgi:hypothetical protein